MKKLMDNLLVKIVAVMIFVACVVASAFGSAGLLMLDANNYWGKNYDAISKETYGNVAKCYSAGILGDVAYDGEINGSYDCDPELKYVILKTSDKLDIADLNKGIFDNGDVMYGSLDKMEVSGVLCAQEGWEVMVYEPDMPVYHGFIEYRASEDMTYYEIDTAMDQMDDNADKYYILYAIDYGATEGSIFDEAHSCAAALAWCSKYAAVLVIVTFLTGLALFVFLMAASKKTLSFDNKIPYIILFGLTAGVEMILIACVGAVFEASLYFPAAVMLSLMFIGLGALVFVYFCMNTATRIKAHSFMRYTLLHYIMLPVRSLIGNMNENLSLAVKAIIFCGVLGVVQFLGLIFVHASFDFGLFLFVIYKLIELAGLMWVVMQFDRVKKGMAMVASGNTDASIDTSHMLPAFKSHAADITNVSEGINKAVEERMKSERMKTELITNVSHDIKTPLTSIINYVDLMEKHGTDDPEMQEYLEVLDRQSDRLKKLIEDLIEASKASSGAIEMQIEPVNVSVLLSQVEGEFEEKLKKKELIPVVTVPEEEQTIKADGRYLWRVIDNLMSNICKYTMPNTRVYVDLISKGDTSEISFKNISATELNISAEELTERFVRGDKSRNTEGSGLGLSIAKSLTEHMGGTMDIHIDGDLFKVTLTFPKV